MNAIVTVALCVGFAVLAYLFVCAVIFVIGAARYEIKRRTK